jgi:hydrogenase maturation protein HypF
VVLPDLATCDDCLHEINDPHDRRYLYPFTSCTHCGPRFSIMEALPYDRQHTSMRHFPMCGQCQAEYEAPQNRRFHAQPNACPDCGPQLTLWDRQGQTLASTQEALAATADAIRAGAIVAVKGLGGFHLMVEARHSGSVARLRHRKHRPEKPFAVMYPSLAAVQEECEVSPVEKRLLQAPEAPIVLLKHRTAVDSVVAPGNPYLGVMLPYTPLHHLLLRAIDGPVVATSGNRTEEPICIDEHEALQRLVDIADLFLVHDRPIVRRVDDTVIQVVLGQQQVLRCARGYAPLSLQLPTGGVSGGLAVGGHLKNTVACSSADSVYVSQHLGDLETEPATVAFAEAIAQFGQLYDFTPQAVACDAHPDYFSSRYAATAGLPIRRVQHHYAHVLSCMAEHALAAPVLGVAWDGNGYGLDGTLWGGEFLRITTTGFERLGHVRPFPLPGGVQAIQEPRRTALGLLYSVFGAALFAKSHLAPVQACSVQERQIIHTMLQRQLNTPYTSSVGRLFDAVAAILGLRQRTTFEGQAAMDVEFAMHGIDTDAAYPFDIEDIETQCVIDWAPMVHALLADQERQCRAGHMAAKFHNTLVDMIVTMAQRLGEQHVVLTGGCFQNRPLTERAVRRLRDAGLQPYWHQRVPPNDGGLALGQLLALHRQQQETLCA